MVGRTRSRQLGGPHQGICLSDAAAVPSRLPPHLRHVVCWPGPARCRCTASFCVGPARRAGRHSGLNAILAAKHSSRAPLPLLVRSRGASYKVASPARSGPTESAVLPAMCCRSSNRGLPRAQSLVQVVLHSPLLGSTRSRWPAPRPSPRRSELSSPLPRSFLTGRRCCGAYHRIPSRNIRGHLVASLRRTPEGTKRMTSCRGFYIPIGVRRSP